MTRFRLRPWVKHLGITLAIVGCTGAVAYIARRAEAPPSEQGRVLGNDGSLTAYPIHHTEELVAGIGVNVHMQIQSYVTSDTDSDFFNSTVLPGLRELGVRIVRDGLCSPSGTPTTQRSCINRFHALNEASDPTPMKLMVVPYFATDTSSWSYPTTTCFAQRITLMINGGSIPCGPEAGQSVTSPGMDIYAIEGPNEVDHCPSYAACSSGGGSWYDKSLVNNPNWDTVLPTFMNGLRSAMNSVGLNSLPLVGPSLINAELYSGISTQGGASNLAADLASVVSASDAINAHLYCGFSPLSTCLGYNPNDIDDAQSFFGTSKPVYVTEFGYADYPSNDAGAPLNPIIAGKFTGRALLDMFDTGARVFTWYELLDEDTDYASTLKESSWGLIRQDGTRKPAYTSLQNTIALLEDPGSTPTLDSSINLRVTAANTVRTTAFAKRDGTTWLAIRNETSSSTTSDATASTSITFPETYETVRVYRPTSGSSPTDTHSDISSLTLSVPDDLILLELVPEAQAPESGGGTPTPSSSATATPSSTATATPTATPAATATSSGSSTSGGSSTGSTTDGGTTTEETATPAPGEETATPVPTPQTPVATVEPTPNTLAPLPPVNSTSSAKTAAPSRLPLIAAGGALLAALLAIAFVIWRSARASAATSQAAASIADGFAPVAAARSEPTDPEAISRYLQTLIEARATGAGESEIAARLTQAGSSATVNNILLGTDPALASYVAKALAVHADASTMQNQLVATGWVPEQLKLLGLLK